MKLNFTTLFAAIALITVSTPLCAVELLISGDFEAPGGVGDIPGWTLEEFITGSDDLVNSADITAGEDVRLFLRPFVAGGPLTTGQGNFDSDGTPAGDVDGTDFLTWQRNFGLTGSALPEQGDANADMNVDGVDYDIWQSNYGTSNAGTFTNARLAQVVPAAAGETYSFQGTSTFEDIYSGFATTLDAGSPNGAIPSPTVTQFRMEFLDSGGGVIGTPTVLDLRTEQTFPGFPIVHTPLVAQAPGGTTNVRVIAEALDMAWNGNSENMGLNQSAFFNDFSLENTASPGTDLLTNGNLDLGSPDALDFWNQLENPETVTGILRAGTGQAFSNHPATGGSRGVWLSAFFGAHPNFQPDPVDGSISQTVEAVEGGTYTFSGWMKFEQNYSGGVDTISATGGGFFAGLASPTQSLIRLEFLDIDSNVISTSEIDVKAERQAACPGGDANSQSCGPAADGWLQHTLESVAPSGTVFARLTAIMEDAVYNDNPQQSAFWDDFSLDGPAPGSLAAVPEPTSLVSLVLGGLLLSMGRARRQAQ